MNRPALIVDDNDDYTAMILTHLEPLGYRFERARSASEGLETFSQSGSNRFSLIVTDITMEGQTAGLKLIRQIRRSGYRGVLMVASTGFNIPIVLHLSRIFLALWGVDLLVPKEPLRAGKFQCVPVSAAGKAALKSNEIELRL